MNYPWKGFVFTDVDEDLLQEEHDLGHGLALRRATQQELQEKSVASMFSQWSQVRGLWGHLQQRMPPKTNSYSHEIQLPPEQWRHAVVECRDPKLFSWDVDLAFSLSKAELRMGYIVSSNGQFRSSPYLAFQRLHVRSPLGGGFVEHDLPALRDLPEIKENVDYVLTSLSNGFPTELRNVIHIFSSIDELADSSLLKALGYFSVIEGLLSHSPLPTDRMDSIQRQLVRNINLLNNRLEKVNRQLPFADFGKTSVNKILEKMYAFRSAIAHGGSIEQPLREIDKLRPGSSTTNHLWVHDWLRQATKRLILAAIIEPDLVADLK